MASPNKQVLQKTNTESKNFNYSFGNVQLNFSLRVDIKTEMVDFLKLLKEGTADVEKELNTRFPSTGGPTPKQGL